MDRSGVVSATVKQEKDLFNLSPASRSRCNWLDKLWDSGGFLPNAGISKVVVSIRYTQPPCSSTKDCSQDEETNNNKSGGECKVEQAEEDVSCTWNLKRAEQESERCDSTDNFCRCKLDGRTSSNSSSQLQGSCSLEDGGESNVQRQLVYTFGLPAKEFESLCMSCKRGEEVKRKEEDHRKRKQEHPVRRVVSRRQELMGLALQRKGKELMWSGEYNMQDKTASPHSEEPTPSHCRVEVAVRDEYVTVGDESEEKNTWKSCMEKMKAFSLRSDSSTDTDANKSESTLDSLSSHGKEERMARKRTRQSTPFHVEGLRSRLFHANGFTGEFQLVAHSVRASEQTVVLSADFRAMSSKLLLDHPSREPKDTLLYSLYQVFKKAGKGGLTAREAVSKILEKELPGLDECGVAARAEVRKMLRNSPYFMELGDKFVLCSAITGLEDKVVNGSSKGETSIKERLQQQSWIAHAVRRARTGKSRRKALGLDKSASPEKQKVDRTGGGGGMEPRKRLKTVQQDSTGLGNRCNRSDGKGWHCPLFAQVGYSLCDHHLDRLRAKSGSRARRPNRKKAEKQQQQQQQQQQPQQHQKQQPLRHRHKQKVVTAEGGGTGSGRVESTSAWGIRQSLSVARGGKRSNMFRSKRLQQQQEERHEQRREELSGEATVR